MLASDAPRLLQMPQGIQKCSGRPQTASQTSQNCLRYFMLAPDVPRFVQMSQGIQKCFRRLQIASKKSRNCLRYSMLASDAPRNSRDCSRRLRIVEDLHCATYLARFLQTSRNCSWRHTIAEVIPSLLHKTRNCFESPEIALDVSKSLQKSHVWNRCHEIASVVPRK